MLAPTFERSKNRLVQQSKLDTKGENLRITALLLNLAVLAFIGYDLLIFGIGATFYFEDFRADRSSVALLLIVLALSVVAFCINISCLLRMANSRARDWLNWIAAVSCIIFAGLNLTNPETDLRYYVTLSLVVTVNAILNFAYWMRTKKS